jgi:hypothetical protein
MAGELPVTVNLDAYQGDSWFQTFRLLQDTTPVDLTGASVTSECRGPGTLVYDMPVQIGDPTTGQITLVLPDGIRAGSYRYDVQVQKAGTTTTWVSGHLEVASEITPS